MIETTLKLLLHQKMIDIYKNVEKKLDILLYYSIF